MALFSKTKKLLRRRLRRPHRLARRLRKDIVHIIALSDNTAELRKDILDLAKEAGKDKKALKELRDNVAELVSTSREYIDYFVKVFVDAEALVSDAAVNISMKLSNTLNRLARQGFPREKTEEFISKFSSYNSQITGLRQEIAMLSRKAARGRGGVSVASTAHLEKEIKRAGKDLHGLRKDIAGLMDKLAEDEESLKVRELEEDLDEIFEKVNRELADIKVVAENNRVLVKRFKDAFRDFSSQLSSAKIPDEQVKRILVNAVENIEAYEERALRQARRTAVRQYRRAA